MSVDNDCDDIKNDVEPTFVVFENNNKVLAILFLFLLILNIIIIEKISREVLAESKKLYPRAFA